MEFIALKIIGKVQRVWFRQSTFTKAEELDIKGYVMNLEDGSVYIEAECESKFNLDLFTAWCNEGPENSQVESVEFLKAAYKGYTNFQIVY